MDLCYLIDRTYSTTIYQTSKATYMNLTLQPWDSAPIFCSNRLHSWKVCEVFRGVFHYYYFACLEPMTFVVERCSTSISGQLIEPFGSLVIPA